MRWKIVLVFFAALVGGFLILPRNFKAASVAGPPPQPALFLGRRIAVEEPRGVEIVRPRVEFDPRGGFLVADARARQIRRYSATGKLERVIARAGSGPGEFRHPVGVARLPDGRIIGADMGGQIGIFDAAGEHLLATQSLPIVPIFDVAVLDDSTLAVAGREETERDRHLVHIWDLKRGARVGSFGDTPRHSSEMESAYAFTGSPQIDVRDGKIALAFSLSDSIWVFDRWGKKDELSTVRIPWDQYRPLREPKPAGNTTETQKWLGTFSALASLHWTKAGSFVVQYVDMNGLEAAWSVVGVSRSGTRLYELNDKPRLLAVAPRSGEMLFIDPDSEAENSWVFGAVR